MNLCDMRKSTRLLKEMKRQYDHALTALGVGDLGTLKGSMHNMMALGDELYLESRTKVRKTDDVHVNG